MHLKTLLLSTLCIFSFWLKAGVPVEITGNDYGLVRAGEMSYFIDSINTRSPSELNLDLFVESQTDVVTLDFVDHPIWFHLILKPDDLSTGAFVNINNPLIDSLEVYVRYPNGDWIHQVSSGIDHPFDSRPVNHQNYILPIDFEEESQIECLFRTKFSVPPQFPVKIYSQTTVIDRLGSWDYFKGLFYGIMLVMFLYNLFVSVATKDRAYYYYVAYVFFIALTQTVLDGSFEKYIADVPPSLLKLMLIAFPALSGFGRTTVRKDLPSS